MKNKKLIGKRPITQIRATEMNRACDAFMDSRGLTRTAAEQKDYQRPFGKTKTMRSDVEWQLIDRSKY